MSEGLPGKPSDDQALVARMASGDGEAFAALFRRYQGAVYRFARQMGSPRETAEDVTQEVFVALMETGERFDPQRGSLRVYLYGITRNFLRRRLRKSLMHPEVELARLAEHERAIASSGSVVDTLERSEAVASLRRAISSLPTRYREVIVLCDLHELGYEEAALVVGCPIGTIRSRLSRARRLLAERCLPETRQKGSRRTTCTPAALTGLRRA
jgi:RNA polymerase sigma-70 factor (ECF subfamily)